HPHRAQRGPGALEGDLRLPGRRDPTDRRAELEGPRQAEPFRAPHRLRGDAATALGSGPRRRALTSPTLHCAHPVPPTYLVRGRRLRHPTESEQGTWSPEANPRPRSPPPPPGASGRWGWTRSRRAP